MIRIHRGPAPAELVTRDAANTTVNNALFDAAEADYLSGDRKIDITDAYKIDIVKNTLEARQYNKCCFTEAKFTNDYPQVEHFRPKRGIQHEDRTWLWPGYYWLAYRWENLLLCKPMVNCTYKKNYFPLLNEAQRNRTYRDGHTEEPVFIDPASEDPRLHIVFHEDEPRGVTHRGRETIRLLGLRHPGLTEARREHFTMLQRAKNMVDLMLANGFAADHPTVAAMISSLRDAVKPEAEFSSMAIDLLQGWPHLV